MKHMHYDAIIAFANGEEIQYRDETIPNHPWTLIRTPNWRSDCEYRVKPKETVTLFKATLLGQVEHCEDVYTLRLWKGDRYSGLPLQITQDIYGNVLKIEGLK